MHIDLRVVELLSSKLCHDLISPVSAINNGVELIEDIGGSVVDEAMKLIGDSAVLAAGRLRLYRLAYGRAGSEENLGAKDVKPVVEAYFGGGKVVLDWPESVSSEEISPVHGAMKVLLNLMVLGEEILAYGGAMNLSVVELSGEGKEVCLRVSGRAAQLNDSLKQALNGTVDVNDLTPRTVHAYVTGRFAEHFGLKINHIERETESLEFRIPLPSNEYDSPQSP